MKRALVAACVSLIGCGPPQELEPEIATEAGIVDTLLPPIDTTTTAPVEDTAPFDTSTAPVVDTAIVEAPPPGCAAKLCDDFEAEAAGSAPNPKVWTKSIASSGTIEVTAAQAHRGAHSLHIRAPSGSYETYVKESVTFPATKNTIWGRLWFRFDEPMPKDFVHWNLIEARGKGSNNRIRYGGINNPHGGSFFTNAFLFNVETAGKGEKAIDDDPKPEVPAKTWICVEWMFSGEAGKNESRMFWNGTERPKMHATTPWFETLYTMPTFDALYLGWAIYQPIAKPYEVWIDDVAIGESRIGCD